MKKRTMLGFAAMLAAGAYAAVKLLNTPQSAPEQERQAATPPDVPDGEADDTVAFPLKNKFTDHSDEASGPGRTMRPTTSATR